MAYLKFYETERKRWGGIMDETLLSKLEAATIIKRLTEHFATPPVKLRFGTRHIGKGLYKPFWREISVNKTPMLRILLHEFTHHLDQTLRHETWHDDFMADLMDEVCQFAMEEGWCDANIDASYVLATKGRMVYEGWLPTTEAIHEAIEVMARRKTIC